MFWLQLIPTPQTQKTHTQTPNELLHSRDNKIYLLSHFASSILLVKAQTDYKLFSSGWHKQGTDFRLTGNRLQLPPQTLELFPVP